LDDASLTTYRNGGIDPGAPGRREDQMMTTREVDEYRGDVAMTLRDRGYSDLADSIGGLGDEAMQGYAIHYDEDRLADHLIFMDGEANRNESPRRA